MSLPVYQVRKGQPWPAELFIEPDTKIMQRDFCRQACLKSAEVMGPFAIEAERLPELLLHGLHDLAYSSQPASESLGPRHAAVALRRTDDLGALGSPARLVVGVPLEAFVDDVRPRGWGTHPRQAKVGIAAESKARFRQGLIFGACRTKAAASDHPNGIDCEQQMEASEAGSTAEHEGEPRPGDRGEDQCAAQSACTEHRRDERDAD